MVTVHREGGFRIVIFAADHEPPHVHVFNDGNVKVALAGPDGRPELVYNDGMKAGDVRKAMRIVVDRQDDLLARWKAMHG